MRNLQSDVKPGERIWQGASVKHSISAEVIAAREQHFGAAETQSLSSTMCQMHVMQHFPSGSGFPSTIMTLWTDKYKTLASSCPESAEFHQSCHILPSTSSSLKCAPKIGLRRLVMHRGSLFGVDATLCRSEGVGVMVRA